MKPQTTTRLVKILVALLVLVGASWEGASFSLLSFVLLTAVRTIAAVPLRLATFITIAEFASGENSWPPYRFGMFRP